MSHSRTVEIEGHIIDSGTMQRCFGAVMDLGGSFDVEQFDVGKHEDVESYCRMAVSADDPETLKRSSTSSTRTARCWRTRPTWNSWRRPRTKSSAELLLHHKQTTDRGAVRRRVDRRRADRDGLRADREPDGGPGDPRAYTKVLNAVEEDDLVATDQSGIRVNPPERPRSGAARSASCRAASPLSALGVDDPRGRRGAPRGDRGRRERDGRRRPAVIHSGAGDALAELVEAGYVDALSAGNGFATHDLERSLYGTSLGMDVETLEHPRKGHKHHIWTISEIIRAGGIEAAVEDGIIGEGVMYQCVQNDVDTVLAGSIRDDGPLPDTITDAVEAQNAIRDQAHDADIVLMLATLLHSVAVGNCLPSTTKTVCVDINPPLPSPCSTDRGSGGRDGHRHRDVRPHARGVRAGRGGGGSERRGGDHRGLRRVTAALRPYDPETDADALYEMKTAFERGLGESTGGDEKAAAYEGKLTDDYRESWLAWVDRCVSDDERCVTVAVEEEEGNDPNLVGYVFVLPERLAMIWDAAVINELYVVPESRGTGVADELMGAAVALAGDQDLPLDRIVLDVDPANERAQRFYDRHGFEQWGEMVARSLDG